MNIRIIAIALLLIALPVSAQKKKTVVNALIPQHKFL